MNKPISFSVVVAFLAISVPAAASDLPLNPEVTQTTVGGTICAYGWTRTVRPPRSVTGGIKRAMLAAAGLPPEDVRLYELDHRIPLALGGAPEDPRNLELQPWPEAGAKDYVEVCLARAVCEGAISLDEARRRIWADWRRVGVGCDL